MEHSGFFIKHPSRTIGEIAEKTGAKVETGKGLDAKISGVAALSEATSGDISFLDNRKYIAQAAKTQAGACFIREQLKGKLPENTIALVTGDPYAAHAITLELFYEEVTSASLGTQYELHNGAHVATSARLEDNVSLSPGAIIEGEAVIGSGTHIGPGTVIGVRSVVGRECKIDANVTVQHALIGNHVLLHAGAAIGQDGFGFAMGAGGHQKVMQIGRVVLQDRVDIGANTTIDRGAIEDTIIGEGTKIDNQVQIGHNVQVGRHCVIVAQTGIAGSAILEDYVVMGGQSAVNGHITLGQGVQVAANGKVAKGIPAGEIWGGAPAKPIRQWQREIALLKSMALKKAAELKRQRN